MLKYKYVIYSGNFSNIEEFQAHLNIMGKKGYELVQWHLFNFVDCRGKIQPTSDTLLILITWKIEDHDS